MDHRATAKLRRRDVIALFAGAAANWPLARTAMAQFTPFRGGGLEANVQKALGDLGELTGTWMGNGFSLVSLPDPDKDPPFRLQLNATKEILTFTPIGAKSPTVRASSSAACITSSKSAMHLQALPCTWSREFGCRSHPRKIRRKRRPLFDLAPSHMGLHCSRKASRPRPAKRNRSPRTARTSRKSGPPARFPSRLILS